jgi:hypothetical protein
VLGRIAPPGVPTDAPLQDIGCDERGTDQAGDLGARKPGVDIAPPADAI